MITDLATASLLLACAFTPVNLPIPTAGPADDAGFQEVLFDSATLDALIKDESVMGLRFYNAMASSGAADGTVLAIGILADGSEKNAGKAYRMSIGIVNGEIKVMDLNSSAAKAACANMAAAGHPSYSASFTRSQIEALLDLEGCQALQASPADSDKGQSMILTAMKLEGDRAVPLGSGPSYQQLCGYPCPTVCGPKRNYVNQ